MKKCLDILIAHTEVKRRLKKVHNIVKANCERRIRKHYMYTLLIRYNKVSLMK